MARHVALIFAVIALVLAGIGIGVGNEQLWSFINVDAAMDVGRLALAALLLRAVFAPEDRWSLSGALALFGAVYLAVGIAGFFDGDVGNLFPHQLTLFDKIYHLASGAIALVLAGLPLSTRPKYNN